MAHGHRPTVVQLIKYLQKLWEGTGKALGGRARLAATLGGGGGPQQDALPGTRPAARKWRCFLTPSGH